MYQLKIRYCEVYKEKIYDLLDEYNQNKQYLDWKSVGAFLAYFIIQLVVQGSEVKGLRE